MMYVENHGLAGPQYDKSGNPLMYRGEPFSYNVSVTSFV